MTSVAQWVSGARPRTLPNSIAPVLAGWSVASALGPSPGAPPPWTRGLLTLVVATAMQIGVNFANDYSDGIRGTDERRVGPMRLVGSDAAPPKAVRAAALTSFAVAGLAGLVLVALTGYWWLLALGALCVTAAWCYTGGPRPYGYSGLGELAVFVFFGLVAVLGTQYVLSGRITLTGAAAAVAVGAMSAAVLVTNNLRDIPTDTESGKRTLAVRLGDRRTRTLYAALMCVPFVVSLGWALTRWSALASLLALFFALLALRRVRGGARGADLIPALRDTAMTMLVWALALAVVSGLGW